MQADSIYEETVPFPLIRVVLAILTIFTLLMLFLLVYQLIIGPLGSKPAPSWFYLVMFLFLAVITVFITNFTKLSIKITSQAINISFGMIKQTILWGGIEDCYLDEAAPLSYGGWGIRIAKVKGKWRRVYNVVGYSGVVLSLNKGRFREFVFSTNNPQEVLGIVGRQIGKT